MTGGQNPISLSISPAMRAIGKRYDNLPGILELMRRLWQEAVLDGFEFQNLAEWDAAGPPRDEAAKRLADWETSERYTVVEIASQLQSTNLPILSVHANRDVGICLCSGDRGEIAVGERLIRESLALAEKVGAQICVFHLWDTWKRDFDPACLKHTLHKAAAEHPGVRASVENVPTHLAGYTPFELAQAFEWITLDLQWAALYDELDRFGPLVDHVVNVHLRGRLEGSAWVLDGAAFGFYEALHTIREEWGYRGLLTMEPNALHDGELERLVVAMASLRGNS